jgi:hypothetical protein
MLACSCLIPDGWANVPIPDEEYDFNNPAVFVPLLVCMAPYGAVVFTVAARPRFDDGTVQDWAEYLAAQNNLVVERIRQARVNRMPCILVDATMASEMGPMRSRSIFLEDGGRLFNIGTLAPDAIWPSVEADFDRLLGSFALEDVQGITAAPLRLMTSESAVELSAPVQPPAAAETAVAGQPVSPETETLAPDPASASPAEPANWLAADDTAPSPNDRPTQPADVALADDPSTLDQDHELNARLRDNGVGLVPRVISVATREKYAVVGAGAIEATFHVPFGWHVIDDGKRTLVFDRADGVQINLDLRYTPAGGAQEMMSAIAQSLAEESPQAQFLTFELMDMPCLAVRDLRIEGEPLDQAYFFRPSHRDGLTLVCRVTADRENMTRAMNTAEVIIGSLLSGALPPDPEFAGQPDWWRDAVLLERADRIADAEQTIKNALDHIGVYSSLAYLHELRYARLLREGKQGAAAEARERAIEWLYAYAGSATSGGEGAALSLERDQRIAALGGEAPVK